MRILFLGDIVGPSGCNVVKRFLPEIIKKRDLDFVVANGENAADSGLGITEKISNELFQCGINVLTTGNHVWDQKETVEHIEREKKLLRPYNLTGRDAEKSLGNANITCNKNGIPFDTQSPMINYGIRI